MKALLTTATAFLAGFGALAAEPEVAEIRVANNNSQGLAAQREKPREVSSSRASKFRLVPGLSEPKLVSLELVGAKGHYVVHNRFVMHVLERSKLNPVFDASATFKMVTLPDGNIRFESANKPRAFITLDEKGAVILAGDRPPEKSNFVLKK